MKLHVFNEKPLFEAMKSFFQELNVPISEVTEDPANPENIVSTYFNKANEAHALIDTVYFLGMVNENAFDGEENSDSLKSIKASKEDYDGLLIFGIQLKNRANGLNPTRSQLAEITRLFNREFNYTPVTLIFKYAEQIAFANSERLKYKQEWREGEKVGKISLLRDIDIEKPHTGHLKIIDELRIKETDKQKINSFSKLYEYWQKVFNVSILNKQFYNEIQKWYFWAVKEVTFPNAPNRFDFDSDEKFDAALTEHKSKNVIRLLTRILFIWFIKEKKLIPEEIFDGDFIESQLLKDFTPQKPHGVFATGKQTSMYYRAILQNLFFATLNQEMGKREYRKDKAHRNVTNLMRYQNYFKKGGDQLFVDLVEKTVPFMNGGLFECLDKPHPTAKGRQGGDVIIYADGFSDRDDNELQVPDFLFFDVDEDIDISSEMGSTNRVYKQSKTRGLLEILQSYKFTIAENTPVEEDVALDPELLGRVFENLLASYNPETKTTARKQTGSFYTPREIVNYMVDESLIAYLKNKINDWQELNNEEVDKNLHGLLAFDNTANTFDDKPELQSRIIKALDSCKILDPACGSGAFPMGVLQKMVHILHKLDSNNTEWEQRQIERVNNAIANLEEIDDSEFREKSIKELENQIIDIEEAFANNELDYGRKLYLIENCIYGVDIQSIAIQISKLRFFISLIVDQKIDTTKTNYGVRPLPNLETKFVAANTLIGIEKPDAQLNMFENTEVKTLENKLKSIRHKLFSSKQPRRKRELREQDKTLRTQIAAQLEENGWGNQTARQLAEWDPYDQNASSPFFDPEWMFGISDGFDVVIGNPPYLRIQGIRESNPWFADWLSKKYESATGSFDLYAIFTERGVQLTSEKGLVNFIMPVKWTNAAFGKGLRNFLLMKKALTKIISFDEYQVFNASTYTGIQFFQHDSKTLFYNQLNTNLYTENALNNYLTSLNDKDFNKYSLSDLIKNGFTLTDNNTGKILDEILKQPIVLADVFEKIFQGIATSKDSVYFLTKCYVENGMVTGYSKELNKTVSVEIEITKPLLKGDQVQKYKELNTSNVVIFPYKTQNGKSQLMTESYIQEKYPLAYQYLKANEIVLKNREKGRLVNDDFWFRYIYPKNQNLFKNLKLVAPDVSLGGNFTIDIKGSFYSTTTVYGYIKKKSIKESYWYWLSILNSQVLWWYLKNTGAVMANGYFRFKPDYLKPFKFPNPNAICEMEFLSKCLYSSNKKSSLFVVLNSISNALVFNLYFPDHMQERGIDVLDFVERDIEQALQGRDFEKLSDAEKEEVTEQLLTIWTNPNNEVVKRMGMFKEKSPEILKPILES